MFKMLEMIKLAWKLKKHGMQRYANAISDDEARALGDLILYRAQSSLYHYYLSFDANLTWDEFVVIVRSRKDVRKTIEAAIASALPKIQDMEVRTSELDHVEDIVKQSFPEKGVTFSGMWTDTTTKASTRGFLFAVETRQYILLNEQCPFRSWEAYLDEVVSNRETYFQLRKLLLWCIINMDISDYWHKTGVVGILSETSKDLPRLLAEADAYDQHKPS